MKLNCRPGDLAVCINGENAGRLCEVLCAGQRFWHLDQKRHVDGWIVSFPSPAAWGDVTQPENLSEGWYPDEWLRPIRDPGDDAVDETLRNLEVTA